MRISTLLSALALGFVASTAAYALDAAPAPDSSSTAAASTNGSKSARSAECSKEADARGLHGSQRKKFREECKKGKTPAQ